jgi:hypothetical protein
LSKRKDEIAWSRNGQEFSRMAAKEMLFICSKKLVQTCAEGGVKGAHVVVPEQVVWKVLDF